jgi:Pectinacetylesterase
MDRGDYVNMAKIKLPLITLVALLLSACSTASGDAGSKEVSAGSSPGWTRIEAPGASCSDGSDFSFWFRPADPERVVIYLQGGGACWSGELCALDRDPTYDPTVDESDAPGVEGIFNLENPRNPVGAWSMLFIPYCTGDVHLGSRTVTYDVAANDSLAARTFEIRHQGARNVEAALGWLYERISDPSEVLVTGVSAGAIGSAYHAPSVASHYAGARVVQIGDAAGGYRSPTVASLLDRWGASLPIGAESEDATPPDFESFYLVSTAVAPNLDMAQINYDQDEVQLFFLGLVDVQGVPLIELLDANLEEISAALPRFRSYLMPGSDHGIIRSAAFYDVEIDEVALVDWTGDVISGAGARTVDCEVCVRPE